MHEFDPVVVNALLQFMYSGSIELSDTLRIVMEDTFPKLIALSFCQCFFPYRSSEKSLKNSTSMRSCRDIAENIVLCARSYMIGGAVDAMIVALAKEYKQSLFY